MREEKKEGGREREEEREEREMKGGRKREGGEEEREGGKEGGEREKEGGREGKRREGRELKIMYMYTIKYIFFLFCRELRLQHVRMTRDRKSHEKKVCNKMYMYTYYC